MRLVLLQVLCVLSGFTGLVYETLWIRVLSFGVGSTSASMSIVLSIFFLGLSLGGFLYGKFLTRLKPVLFYGAIEAGIGIYAALLILPLFYLQELHAGFALKYFIVFLAILPPTLGMGATLPLLAKVFVRSVDEVGGKVGRLYALNTLGAVLGAWGTAFYLIPNIGIMAANFLAVMINLIIGVVAILLHRRMDLGDVAAESEHIPASTSKLSTRDRWILLGSGICGFSSISSEVVWNKYLGIYFGTNIYGLGLTLAVFLIGIVVGSFAFSVWIARSRNLFQWYVGLFIGAAAAVWITSFELSWAPYGAHLLHKLAEGSLSTLTIKSLVAIAILFLPTCIFGALFPLSIALLAKKSREVPKIVGLAYGINTLGAILGAYFAGIVLLPTIGSSHTIQISALLLLAIAVVFVAQESIPRKRAVVTVSASLALLILVTGHFNFKPILSSAYPGSFSRETGEEFLMIEEGETAVISLSHDPRDGENYQQYLRLKTNGLNESIYNRENLDELPKYEALIGLLPYVFSRNPKNAFIVGYGGGFTVDFLSSTDLENVNVVELEKGILKAADYVFQGKNPITKRKNVHLTIEDARYALVSQSLGPQDIIVSQPSHSWLSGAANLFTKEFFLIVRKNLSEKGIFAQWLNLYNMDVEVLQSILKTFFTVFPHGAVFTEGNDDELVLLGSSQPLVLNFQKLNLLSQNRTFKKKLTQVFRHSPYDLLSLYSIARSDVLELTRDASFNTDVNTFAETRQSIIFYEGLKDKMRPQTYLSSVFQADYESITRFQDIVRYSERYGLDKTGECYLANALVKMSQMKKADTLFAKMSVDVEGYTSACGNFFNRVMGEYFLAKKNPRIAIPFLEAYYKIYPRDRNVVSSMIQGYRQIGDTANEEQFVAYLESLKVDRKVRME